VLKVNKYEPSDKALLGKVADGDEAAFSRLYYIYEPRLSSFIYKITKSKEITAEIVHDVFLKIWMGREALQDVKNFDAFLFVISRNLAINAFHKAMRELRRLESLHQDLAQEEDYQQEEQLLYNVIDSAIEQLPPRQKEVFLLNRYERLTYDQIGKKLNIGKETVKTHIQLAMKSIKRTVLSKNGLPSLLVSFLLNNF
jgi:RNA polymerase sigma-70 factor (ECF subfamily)